MARSRAGDASRERALEARRRSREVRRAVPASVGVSEDRRPDDAGAFPAAAHRLGLARAARRDVHRPATRGAPDGLALQGAHRWPRGAALRAARTPEPSDRWMPLRMYVYLGRIWEHYVEHNQSADRLPPILAIVLQHSERGWSAPVSDTGRAFFASVKKELGGRHASTDLLVRHCRRRWHLAAGA